MRDVYVFIVVLVKPAASSKLYRLYQARESPGSLMLVDRFAFVRITTDIRGITSSREEVKFRNSMQKLAPPRII